MREPFRPRLRDGLRLVPREPGGDLIVEDDLLDRRLVLEHHVAAIAERVDGVRTAGELMTVFDAWRPPVATARREAALRSLLLLNLLDDADELAAAARQLRDRPSEARPIDAIDAAGFRCAGSGDCCHVYQLGPLDDRDLERFDALPLREVFPALGDAPAHVEQDGERFLRRTDQGCVFLTPSGHCGLHRELGRDAKPGICRVYPLSVRLTVHGYRIGNEGECSRSSSTTTVERMDEAQARQLVADAGTPARIEHPLQRLPDGLAVDFDHVDRFLRGLHARLDRLGPDLGALDMVAHAGRAWRRLLPALSSCPLAPGAPRRAIDEALTAEDPRDPPPDAPGAIASLAGALLRELLGAVAREVPTRGRRAASRRELGDLTLFVAELADARACGVDPGALLREAMALPADTRVEAALRSAVLSHIASYRATRAQRPLIGLLDLTTLITWTHVGARMAARLTGARAVTTGHFDEVHATVQRVIRFLPASFWQQLEPVACAAAVEAPLLATTGAPRPIRALPVLGTTSLLQGASR